eukprot:10334698-Alexandrium_andersonii.AAC.1
MCIRDSGLGVFLLCNRQHRGRRPIACRVQDCHHGADGLRGKTAGVGDPCSARDVEPQLLARRARPSG